MVRFKILYDIIARYDMSSQLDRFKRGNHSVKPESRRNTFGYWPVVELEY